MDSNSSVTSPVPGMSILQYYLPSGDNNMYKSYAKFNTEIWPNSLLYHFLIFLRQCFQDMVLSDNQDVYHFFYSQEAQFPCVLW